MKDFAAPPDSFSAKLLCRKTNNITYSGPGKIIWQDEVNIDEIDKQKEGKQFLRFCANIPKELEQTKIDSPGKVSWWIQLTAAMGFMDYSADFEIPVFVERPK